MSDTRDGKAVILTKISLEQCTRPLICSHIRLDGDAVGSELGLYHILKALGKSPHIVNPGEMPDAFRFIRGASQIGTGPAELRDGYDLVVVLDCPHFGRLDELPPKWPTGVRRLNIDHHASNENYLDVNWIDPSASSVGEMLFELAKSAGWPIPKDAATAFYLALITDTNRFSLPHTTARSMRVAAGLLELGAEHVEVAERVFYSDPPGIVRLKGLTLSAIRFAAGGRVAVGDLTMEMFEKTGARAIDTQEFAEFPRSIQGVDVGLLFREMGDGKIKVSFRSRSNVDIEQVARLFGGGGHPQAAGCVIDGNIADVEKIVVDAVEKMLDGRSDNAGGK